MNENENLASGSGDQDILDSMDEYEPQPSHLPGEESIFDFKMPEKLNEGKKNHFPSGQLVGGDHHDTYDALKKYFLSPTSRLDADSVSTTQIQVLSDQEVYEMCVDSVEDFDMILGRTGACPVSVYIVSSYREGLPIFQANQTLNDHTIKALQFIFYKLKSESAAKRKLVLRRLVDAYTACQMEQGRVIDAIYGTLSGRDQSFKQQVLSLLDVQKDRLLTEIINRLNPHAWQMPDDDPTLQIPHIYSSYAIAIGDKIGLRGAKAAHLDRNAVPIAEPQLTRLHELYCTLFSVEEFITSFINDVNQQGTDADRFLNRDLLGQWAGSEKANGFDPFVIYFNEDLKEKYQGEPTSANKFQPFLCKDSAVAILKQLFLTVKKEMEVEPNK